MFDGYDYVCAYLAMNLRHIEVFHAVYLTGSVSAAAKVLNVSQPTVSKVLRHAEDKLSFKLFDRQGGRLSPTDRGAKLFDKIEPIFETINELNRFTRRLAEERSGLLRFAMTPAFGLEVSPVAIAKFSKNNPDVTIEAETLHATQLIKAIGEGDADIGLVFDAPYSAGLHHETIGSAEFICVSPENSNFELAKTLRLEALEKYPLITLNAKSVLGQVLNNKISDDSKSFIHSPIIVETYHLAKRLVRQGAGVAVIDSITAYSGDAANLRFHRIEQMPKIGIDIITRSNVPVAKIVHDFKEDIREAIATLKTPTAP